MGIEVKRKDRETVGAMIRRFSRRVQQSGLLREVKKGRFYSKPKTKREKRAGARRREDLTKIRKKLFKLGLLKEGEMIPKEKIRKELDRGK